MKIKACSCMVQQICLECAAYVTATNLQALLRLGYVVNDTHPWRPRMFLYDLPCGPLTLIEWCIDWALQKSCSAHPRLPRASVDSRGRQAASARVHSLPGKTGHPGTAGWDGSHSFLTWLTSSSSGHATHHSTLYNSHSKHTLILFDSSWF